MSHFTGHPALDAVRVLDVEDSSGWRVIVKQLPSGHYDGEVRDPKGLVTYSTLLRTSCKDAVEGCVTSIRTDQGEVNGTLLVEHAKVIDLAYEMSAGAKQ